MKYRIVPIKNVARLSEAGDALLNRDINMPGMGLIWGPTGYGKTTAATWFVNQQHGVYVRALATSTPSSMLASICRELHIEPRVRCAAMVEQIVQKLTETGRPLFIDEADYLVESKRLTETLRDVHDLATVPVILIGMANMQAKLANRKQLIGRVAQWVEFAPCDAHDARMLADTLCEVRVADDLLARLHDRASGSVRLITVGLGRIEQNARARGLDKIGEADWRGGDDFFLGRAPTPTTKRSGRVAQIAAAGAR